jgi:hypothetical protein
MIYPWDTYIGFRELGFNIVFSLLAVLIINLNFSYPTRLAHSYIPDPFFRVYVDSIHTAKVSNIHMMFFFLFADQFMILIFVFFFSFRPAWFRYRYL